MTSSGSAELIAVSSLFTYDGYWHYINPRATGKQLLLVSRILILAYTVLMGESPTHHTPPPSPSASPLLYSCWQAAAGGVQDQDSGLHCSVE